MQAVIQYSKIVTWLEMEYGLSEKEAKASDSFLLAAYLNLAMCYLKLREYIKAVECCDKVESAWGGGPTLHLSLHPHPWAAFPSSQPRVRGVFIWLYLFLFGSICSSV